MERQESWGRGARRGARNDGRTSNARGLARLWAASMLVFLAAWLSPRLASADAARIVVWHAYRGDEERALAEAAKRFQQTHGIEVDLLAIPFDAYASKLTAAIPRAHGPDLFIEAHERMGSYLGQKLIAPIGDALPDEDVPNFNATAVSAVTLGGTRYAVPLANKCLALYVNSDLLPETPPSLEAFAAAAKAMPAGVYPLVYETQNPYAHAPIFHAFGGSLLDENERFGFVGEPATRSLGIVESLLATKAVPEEASGALVSRMFGTGMAGAAISGPWLVSDLPRSLRFRVEPLPRVEAANAPMRPFLTVEAIFVTPEGAKRDEARAFARFLGGHDGAVIRAITGWQVVATESAWTDLEVAKNTRLAAFHAAAQNAVPMPTSAAMRATWVPAAQAIRKVLRGDTSAEAATHEAARRFEDITRPLPPPASPAPFAIALGLVSLLGAFFALRRAREPSFRRALRGSLPAYAYVAHAAVVVILLVFLPLLAGAVTSLFVGTQSDYRFVGLANYIAILTARGGPLFASGSFYLTLAVTLLWTVSNVALHVAIGLTLGVLLSRPMLALRPVYRVLLILPWAVPSYVTALAWKGMFHRQYGAVNALLKALGAEPISWFSNFSTAFAANVATNVWLGFPFMMVVTMGALTAIPRDVLEAAEVDGATRIQRFRHVTLPLLAPALLPAVVLGAVWTFNMFNVVYLVSGGEPDGTTDILMSEAYRWAFTREAQYGYAAAYAVLIFLLLFFGSRLFSRVGTRRDEVLA